MPAPSQLGQEWPDRIRREPVFRLVARSVHLQEHGSPPARFLALSLEVADQFEAVDRLDHRHQRQGPSHLVPLKVTDQMPSDRHAGQPRGFVPKVLGPALAKTGTAGLYKRPNLRIADEFRHGHQCDLLGRPATSPGGLGDPAPYLGEIGANRLDEVGHGGTR